MNRKILPPFLDKDGFHIGEPDKSDDKQMTAVEKIRANLDDDVKFDIPSTLDFERAIIENADKVDFIYGYLFPDKSSDIPPDFDGPGTNDYNRRDTPPAKPNAEWPEIMRTTIKDIIECCDIRLEKMPRGGSCEDFKAIADTLAQFLRETKP